MPREFALMVRIDVWLLGIGIANNIRDEKKCYSEYLQQKIQPLGQ